MHRPSTHNALRGRLLVGGLALALLALPACKGKAKEVWPNKIELKELKEQPALTIKASVSPKEIGKELRRIFSAIQAHLAKQKVKAAGPAFIIYPKRTKGGSEIVALEAGVPLKEAIKGEGEIKASKRPGGKALSTTLHYESWLLVQAHRALRIHAKQKKLTWSGLAMEIYHNDPAKTASKKLKAEILHLLKAPVDLKKLEAEVARYLADPKVAAARGDTPKRPPWEKMGRRLAVKGLFGGKPPKLTRVEKWLKADPELWELWSTFEGNSSDSVDDEAYMEVVKAARARTSADPQDTRARFLLAMGLKEIRQEKAALELLQAVIQKEPGLWKAHLEAGILLSDMKRFDEALRALDRAEILIPDYEVYLNRGIALCFALRFDDSEWDLWKAVEKAPYDGNAYYDIAWVHAQRKEPALAVEALRFASRDPYLFKKRLSQETLLDDIFFDPVMDAPEFRAYRARLPSHDLCVERNWPTLSRFAMRRSLLERILGIAPEMSEDR